MKSFEIKITGNAKSLVDSIKSSQSAMDALIKGIDKADKKLEVLTQTGSHLSNIDKQLAKLKTDYPDIFEKIFPNIDSQINESMKPILQMPELVEQTMTKVVQKMKAIDNGTLKATDDDIKELGNDMRILGETLHLENLDMSFLDGTAKAETKIKRLIDVMGKLVETYFNVNRAAANVDMGEVTPKKKSKDEDKSELTVNALRKKVEEIKNLSEKALDDDDAFDLMDKKIQSLIKMFKVSDDVAAKLDEELQNIDNSVEETMSKLEKMLGNQFPKAIGNAADAADDAGKKIQKLLPTSEGLEKLRIIPDGDQKARISEYAEEYRVILKLLEKGNIESKETVQALRERARTLKNIIKDVNPGDTTLDKLLTDGYGISKDTANTVASTKLSSKFQIDAFKSENISNDARQEAINLIHQEIVAENQLAQKKKEELEDAKIKAKENEEARIAAEAEAKAAKEAAEAARLQAEEKEKARLAAEAEAKLAHSQSNVSSNNKILLYRYGRTDFSDKDFAYSDTMGEIVDSLKIGFGGFGDGMYSVVGSAVSDIVQSMTKPTDSNHDYFEIDASKYKLFINQTEEEASRLQSFLMNLQKFVLSAGDFRGFDDDIANIDNNSLFNEAKSIFKQFDMKQDEFNSWIQQMKQIVVDNKLDSNGKFNTEDAEFLKSHNFGTRFMQKLGYEGIVNKTGNVEFDGMAQGSVIFDPNYEEIIKYLEETGNKSKWAADLLKLFKQEAVDATSSIENGDAAGSSFELLNDGVEKAKRTLEEFRLLQNEILGKSATAEGGSMDGEAIGRYTERVETAKAKLDELAKQSLLTADQIKEANDIYETTIGNLESKSRANNDFYNNLATDTGKEPDGSYDSGYDKGYNDAYNNTRADVEDELASLRTQLAEARADLSRTQTSIDSGTPIDTSVELQSLEKLRAKLEEVKNAIIAKNKAFNDEGTIVGQVVGKEVNALSILLTRINDVSDAITQLINNINSSSEISTGLSNVNINVNGKVGEGSSSVDVSSITSAIKEAIYSKDITKAGYTKLTDFNQAFDIKYDLDTEDIQYITSKLNGEIFDTIEEAMAEFNRSYKDLFINKNDYLDVLSKEDLFSKIENNSNNDDWARVVVDAINTQGNNIVQALKIIPSQNASDTINEAELIKAFQIVAQSVAHDIEPRDFFQGIIDGTIVPEKNLAQAMQTLGMLSNDLKATFSLADTGMRNLGVAITENIVIPSRPAYLDETKELAPLLDKAVDLGAAVPRILSSFNDVGKVIELQTRMPGTNLRSSKFNPEDLINATDKQIDGLLNTLEALSKVGLFPDFTGDNILFDKNKGFSLVDVGSKFEGWMHGNVDTFEGMVEYLKDYIYQLASDSSFDGSKATLSEEQAELFNRRLSNRAALAPEDRLVNFDTIRAQNEVQEGEGVNVKITPIMDEGAIAQVVAENVANTPVTVKINPEIDNQDSTDKGNQIPQQKAADDSINNLEGAIDSTTSAINDKTQAFDNELETVQRVIQQEIQELDNLLNKINDVTGAVNANAESFQAEGNAVSESVKQATKIKEETKKKDTFDTDKENLISVVSEYEKSLSGVQFIPDDALNKVSEMQAKLKDITNSNDLAKWKSEWDLLTESIESARKEQEELIFEKQKNQLTGIKNTLSNSYKSAKIDATNVPEELQEVKTGYEDIVARINTCIKQRKILTEEEVAGFAKEAATIKQVLDAYTEKTKVQTKNSSAYGSAFVKNATNKYDRLYSIATNDEFGVSPAVVTKAQELKSVYEQIVSLNKSFANTNPSEEQRIAFNRLTDEFNETYSALDKIIKSSRKLAQSGSNIFELYNDGKTEFDLSSEEGRMTALKEAVNFMSEGKAQIGEFNRECTTLNYTVKNSDGTFTEFTARINEAGTAIIETTGKTQKSTTMFGRFFDELKRKARGIATYLISITSFQSVWQEIRQGITYIKEIDSALTELKKVTDETDETYEKFLDTASKVGSEIGSTIANFTDATADFARLGYSIEEATKLAEAASIYKNVGDGIDSVAQATESIISTMKAFGIEADNSMAIVDKFNEVGNNFAISSTGIGEALQRSASALYESGNTLDESIGLITAANSVIQNPEQVGTALKTLSLRLRGAKVELEEAGEDVDGMADSVSSLQAKLLALTHGKVDIMADASTFKNTTQILREMSKAWEDMTDIERSAALELMGGKRQANILASIIKNYDTVDSVIESSINSQNSAYEENIKWMDSIEGKMTKFNNAVQSLWQDTLGSNAIKDVVDLGTVLVKILDTIGVIPSILGGIAIYFTAIKKNNPITMFKDLMNTIQNFSTAVTNVQTLSKAGVVFDSNSVSTYAAAVSDLSAKQQALALSSAGLTKQQVAEVLAKNGCSEATIKQAVAEASLATAKATTNTITGEQLLNLAAEKDIKLSEQAVTWLTANAEAELTREKILAAIASKDLAEADGMALLAMSGLSAGAKGLGASLKTLFLSNPVGLALMAVTAITGVVSAVKRAGEKIKQTTEETKRAAQEVIDKYNEAKQALGSNKSTIDEISSEYRSLANGVDEFGNNISLTTDQYKRYNEITNKIADMFPEMVSGFTAEGNAIISNKGKVEELTKAYEEQAKAARNAIILGADNVFTSAKSDMDDLNEQIKAYELARQMMNGALSVEEAGDATYGGSQYLREKAIKILEDIGFEKYTGTYAGGGTYQSYGLKRKYNQATQEYEDAYTYEEKQVYAQRRNTFELQYNNILGERETILGKVNKVMEAYLGNSMIYSEMSDKVKSMVNTIVSQLDPADFDYDDEKMYAYINSSILQPIYENKDNVQNALLNLLEIDSSAPAKAYSSEVSNNFKELIDAGIIDEKIKNKLMDQMFPDLKNIGIMQSKVKEKIQDGQKDLVDNLSVQDLKIAYNIDASNISFDELQRQINAIKPQIEKSIVQTYDTIKESIEKFNDVQKQTEEIMLDNTQVTQEYKDSLTSLGISEADLSSCFYENNKLVVKNVGRLKQLVKASKTNISTQTVLARAQARLKYKDLYKQIVALTSGQLNNAKANRVKINTLYQEMSAIQKVISRYSLLEQQLSEVAKTYSDFEEAQSFDSDNDYMSKTEDMLTAAIKAYETADLGTETAQISIKALVPDVEFEGLETVDEKAEKAHEYITETLNKYFTLEFDDDGAIQSAEMKLGNLRKFIEDALSKNVFIGEDWQHFEWSDEFLAGLENAPDKLQYFADKMNVTKEVALAAMQEIKNKDAEWLNGDYGSLFDQIVPETLDAKLQGTITKLAELNVQFANGKLSQEEYKASTKQLNEQLLEQQKAASDACQSFIEINGKMDESQKKLEEYQKQLSSGTDSNGNKLKDYQITQINEQYNKELKNYEGYLEEKKELENKYGLMTEYTVSVALEQNGINVDEINTELTNVKQNIQETFSSDNFKGAKQALEDTYGVIAKINDNGDIEYSVTDKTSDDQKKTLEELGALNSDGTVNIECLYAGLTDEQKAEVDKLETLQDKKNLIDYYLSMDGIDTVQTAIDKLSDTLNNIYELLQTSPMFKANVDQGTKNTLDGLLDKVSSWVGEHWANFKVSVSRIFGGGKKGGDQESNGTANVSGSAHATGNWGLKQNEHDALVGELGMETIVDPHTGRYYTVGNNGAELVDLPKNAIVFNHKQTEELFKNGHINSRGKAYAEGNAHVTFYPKHSISSQWEGTGYSSWDDNTYSIDSAADDISDAADKFEEVFDWFEVLLEEIENNISLMNAKLENAVGISAKKGIYSEIINTEQFKLQELYEGVKLYSDYANKLLAKVPDKYKEMAQNGAVAITDFLGEANEEVVDSINNYREWAKNVSDLNQQIEETKKTIHDTHVESQNMIKDEYDNRISLITATNDRIQETIDLLDEEGKRSSVVMYEEMIKNSTKQLSELQNKRAEMQNKLDEAVSLGPVNGVEKYSSQWYEMVNAISDVDSEINDCKVALEGFQNSINQLHWDNFEKFIDAIDNVGTEISNLGDLIDEEDVVDEIGNWTKKGITALGLYAQEMERAKYRAEQYGKEIEYLNQEYAAGKYSVDEYNEKLQELKDGQWDSIKSYEAAKKSIIDLNKTRVEAIKDGIQKEIDAYSELIDKKKEELSLQKDAHDFSKQVAEQQKNVADLQKKLTVMAGDNSASAIAQKKKLQAELSAAQQELEELYYNHSVEKQQEALDKSLENYQDNKQNEMDALDESLKNEEQVISDSYATIAANTESVAQTLAEIASQYGITLSDSVTKPWLDGANAIGTYKEQLDTSMSYFTQQLEALKKMYADLQAQADSTGKSMIDAINSNKSKTESSTYTPPQSTQPSTPSQPSKPSAPSAGASVTVKKSATNFSRDGGNGTRMQSWVPGSTFTVYKVSGSEVLIGRNGGYTGWVRLSDIEGYAKGTKGVTNDQLAMLDELGEELVLHAGKDGKLQFLTKGTSVIPSDITENLMKLGSLDPRQVLDNNRPSIGAPHIINNNMEINMEIAEVVHIDHADNSSIPDITKAVQKQMDAYMKNINQGLKRYTR